jgi:hypothetical protein
MSFTQQPQHTRIEYDVEPEPEMVEVGYNLSLPAAWPEERRRAVHSLFYAEQFVALDAAIISDPVLGFDGTVSGARVEFIEFPLS